MNDLSAGDPFPLGATVTPRGVNFAIFSEHASRIELCLYTPDGVEMRRVDLNHQTVGVWHVHVGGIGAGTQYGYRVYGPYEPHRGHRFNPHKLVLDPYAKAITGEFVVHPLHYGYHLEHPDLDLSFDATDSGAFMPRGIVTAPGAPPPARAGNRTPWARTQVYELHVKGFTRLHQQLPEAIRGTYLGLADPAVGAYLRSLGITTVELMPLHYFLTEPFLANRGLTNYWGYNTLNFFTPTQRYACADAIGEFRTMVNALHDQGLEVVLDVVYNHTAEGNHMGPTLSYRGIDNRSYYRLQRSDLRFCVNDTGCGNTLNLDHPRVLQLVTDSLRYWVSEMGVDGFRFDLAPVLGRTAADFDNKGPFFKTLAQDPVLNRVKLIAEPWDLGPGGYQLGHFPVGWSEWNDIYRDVIRRFWRGDDGFLPDFARLVHGGSDLFEPYGKPPSASINMVTAHDGFTLADLVSYETKHNEANQEANRDGTSANYSHNHGAEGTTDDPVINERRRKQARNLLMTLFVSQGVPMLLAGDELLRSQGGNNNAYCQDNPTSWIDWGLLELEEHRRHLEFVRSLTGLRHELAELRWPRYVHDLRSPLDGGRHAIMWYHPAGRPMEEGDWHDPKLRTLGLLLDGHVIYDGGTELRGDRETAHRVLVLFNAATLDIDFKLPASTRPGAWLLRGTTAHRKPEAAFEAGVVFPLEERSMCLLVFTFKD